MPKAIRQTAAAMRSSVRSIAGRATATTATAIAIARGVTERDRRQRLDDGDAAAALQPEPDREQPAHRRVDAVKQPEPGEHQPRPQLGGRGHGDAADAAAEPRSDLGAHPPLEGAGSQAAGAPCATAASGVG